MHPILIAVIAALPPTFAAVCALLVSLSNKKHIHEVHLSMNSRLDEFLKLAKTSSFAAGRKSVEDENKETN